MGYTLQHISNILAGLGYTLQIPRAKDPRQDGRAVRKWKEEKLRGLRSEAEKQGRAFFYADESSFFLNPVWRKTYAPKGQPPTVPVWDKSFQHIHACAAVGSQGEFVYTLSGQAYDGEKTVRFLKELLKSCPLPITLVWDGASIHFCKAVKEFLGKLAPGRLKLVKQPSYSPELNASEQLWNYVKNVDLKNTVFKSISSMKKAVQQAFDKFDTRTTIIKSFFKHPDVAFY